MKKLLTVFLALAFMVGTIGCTKSAEKKKETPKTPAADTGDKDKAKDTTKDKS